MRTFLKTYLTPSNGIFSRDRNVLKRFRIAYQTAWFFMGLSVLFSAVFYFLGLNSIVPFVISVGFVASMFLLLSRFGFLWSRTAFVQMINVLMIYGSWKSGDLIQLNIFGTTGLVLSFLLFAKSEKIEFVANLLLSLIGAVLCFIPLSNFSFVMISPDLVPYVNGILGVTYVFSIFVLLYNYFKENNRLENRIERKFNSLKRAEMQLKSRNKELDEFAHVISHDLKAPLRAISMLSTFIKEDNQKSLDERSLENFALIQDRIKRMEGFIQGVLEYRRSAKEDRFDSVNIKWLIEDLKKTLELPASVEIKVKGTFPEVKYNKIQLYQVFQNLIGNAVEHNDKEQAVIEITHQKDQGFHTFRVKDNGPGIDHYKQQRIFELFNSSKADITDTSGIGLSITRKIVENHCGKVWVESESGKGSSFHFTVPVN